MNPSLHLVENADHRSAPDDRLHVVLVDEELPYPATSGKRIRTLNLTLRLARSHRLTYVCHRNADAEEARLAAEYFRSQGITPLVVDRAVPPRRGLRFYARLAANLFSPLPYSVATHTSPALVSALRDLEQRERVDLWHCEWTPYAQALRWPTKAPRLVMAHNVESIIWQRYRDNERNFLKRWFLGEQYRKFANFERAALAEMEQVVAVSEVDAARLRDDFGLRRVEVVENGVDTGWFQPGPVPRDPARLLFLGSLDWRPNLDGVERFLAEVHPTLRANRPDVQVDIVGRNPPAWLRRLAVTTPGVALHADVPDVRPFLATASLLVVPLRIGGGSRLKILEALACATPVVSTRIGAEGLMLTPGEHFEQSEAIGDLAPVILRLLAQPERAAAQAAAGLARVRQRYDWDHLAEQLAGVWRECAAVGR
jgi:glycosyltransferase involved in cell wall biosynthesis